MAERSPGRYTRPADPPPQVEGPGEHPSRWIGDIYPGRERNERSSNCGECARAADSTWHGAPAATAELASRRGTARRDGRMGWPASRVGIHGGHRASAARARSWRLTRRPSDLKSGPRPTTDSASMRRVWPTRMPATSPRTESSRPVIISDEAQRIVTEVIGLATAPDGEGWHLKEFDVGSSRGLDERGVRSRRLVLRHRKATGRVLAFPTSISPTGSRPSTPRSSTALLSCPADPLVTPAGPTLTGRHRRTPAAGA
jgi:hypothetical protein